MIEVRKSTSTDLDFILNIENSVFVNPWNKKSIKNELIDEKNSLNLICELNHKIIGYFFSKKIGKEYHIINIAIDLPFQHKGYGKLFFEIIMKKFIKYGSVFLEVKRTNFPALSLYKKFGFKEIGIRTKYYFDGEDAVLMNWEKSHL